jgi:putative CocE/NonD family hydrolase
MKETQTRVIDCGGEVLLRRGLQCRMSDGVSLVSDHYAPALQSGKLPTILMRQPYGRDIASTVVYAHPAWFARQGYNVVIQDVRGRGDSEGEFYPFLHEQKDGAETIAWLRTLPESDGKVGMYGFSYQGMTQLLAAAARPAGLMCIAPAMAAHDLYHGWFYNNGALRLASSLGWGLQMLKEDVRRRGLREASDRLERAWAALPAQFMETPYGAHPAIHGEWVPPYVRDWIRNDTAGAFWSRMDLSETLGDVTVPALHVSGWYDTYLKGTIDGFRAMTAKSGSELARANQYLLAGPWVHIPWGARIGAKDFGPAADLDTDALLLRWFNHWLKDSGEFASEPKVRHFALNANKWCEAQAWPDASVMDLYLHSAGRANSSKGDGWLDHAPGEKDEAPDAFIVDPEVPVIAPGGIASASGCFNQSALEQGNNLLVYTGAVLDKAVHVFGSPKVSVWGSTSATHADVVVKLVCVRANGDADFVSIGVARSSYLFGYHYRADAARLWEFEIEPTSWVFAVGERLRIEIAGGSFPLFDRNPGMDVKPSEAHSWKWKRSTHLVYHDTERPSAIHLPVAAVEETHVSKSRRRAPKAKRPD